MILKRNRDYSLKINNLGLEINSLYSSSKMEHPTVLYTYFKYIDRQTKLCIPSIKVFFFQLATGRIESVAYKKLIDPFKNDLPASDSDGFRRVCADHKYVFSAPISSKQNIRCRCPVLRLTN
jgi:hypothetical protein